jgi:hypothetical protein
MSLAEITQVAQILALLGVGGILKGVVDRILAARGGRGKARRDEVTRAWDEANTARQQADEDARRRRIAEEFSSRLTRRLIEAPCVDDSTIEPFPNYTKEQS